MVCRSGQWARRALTSVASRSPGAGVDGEPDRFVEHDHIGVLVADVERDVFRRGDHRRGTGRVHAHHVAEAQAVRGPLEAAVDLHQAIVDQAPGGGAGEAGQAARDEHVEAFALGVGEEFGGRRGGVGGIEDHVALTGRALTGSGLIDASPSGWRRARPG